MSRSLNLWWLFGGLAFAAILLVGLNFGPILLLDGADGMVALIRPPAGVENVEYTPGFTRWRFLRVRREWTHAQVLAHLGEPWFRQLSGREGVERWCYSRGRNLPAGGRCRAVVFSAGAVLRLE